MPPMNGLRQLFIQYPAKGGEGPKGSEGRKMRLLQEKPCTFYSTQTAAKEGKMVGQKFSGKLTPSHCHRRHEIRNLEAAEEERRGSKGQKGKSCRGRPNSSYHLT